MKVSQQEILLIKKDKTQYKGNNGYLDNNPRTNRENLVNLKLK